MPDVIPMLPYEDGVAALEWLVQAFGFREQERWVDDEGRLAHGELAIGDGLIMLATPTPEYEIPKHHRRNCDPARRWSRVPWLIYGVLVSVDDVDEHYRHARDAGAVILTEPEDGPDGRRYRAEDLEGHRWMFVERTRRGRE